MSDLFLIDENDDEDKRRESTEDNPLLKDDSECFLIDEDVEEYEGAGEKISSSSAKEGDKGEKKKSSFFGEFFDCVETFCYALVLMVVLFLFVFRYVTVDGTSMLKTLDPHDRLIISNLFYTPKTGDIVVINAPKGTINNGGKPLIKRIIATEGQEVTIDFNDWKVTVNGALLDESYVNRASGSMNQGTYIYELLEQQGASYIDSFTVSFTVEEGKVFVMGDNRNGSTDSRVIGLLDEDAIIGRVLLRIYPNFGLLSS